MMDDFSKSIKSCIALASSLNILEQSGSYLSLNASNEFKKTSREALNYTKIYETGNKLQDFNFMLNDLSFFQFTSKPNSSDLRFAFYPNPLKIISHNDDMVTAESLLVDGYFTDDEFQQFLSEIDPIMDTPHIRYDYASGQHCKYYHPAAHFHIGFNSDNRWPVRRILSPYGFFLSILSLYYLDIWKTEGEKNVSSGNYLDIEYRKEIKKCFLINMPDFDSIEGERLHII
jgi:hypothetical protein